MAGEKVAHSIRGRGVTATEMKCIFTYVDSCGSEFPKFSSIRTAVFFLNVYKEIDYIWISLTQGRTH